MPYFHRRLALRAGVVGLAEFVIGDPLTPEAQAETRRGIFDAHLHIPATTAKIFSGTW